MRRKPSVIKTIAGILLLSVMIFGLFPSMVGCQSSDIELTIIHTNDSHSHLGNVARMATVISEIREEAGAENTLLLDAGDVCGGTVYYSLYRGDADIYLHGRLPCHILLPFVISIRMAGIGIENGNF